MDNQIDLCDATQNSILTIDRTRMTDSYFGELERRGKDLELGLGSGIVLSVVDKRVVETGAKHNCAESYVDGV